MNIFALDKDTKVCAKWHCDKHVVKMILESAQMICTAHHECYNHKLNYEIPYKKAYVNHPCTKWVRESLANYLWLFDLTHELNKEYRYRYDKNINHKSYNVIHTLPLPDIDNKGITPFALAMPDDYKVSNPHESYKNYYRGDKQHLLKYTKRLAPSWLYENHE